MAIIRDYITTEATLTRATLTADVPKHDVNDLLLLFVAKDDGLGGNLGITGTGWNIGGQGVFGPVGGANTVRSGWFYKIATSDSEALPRISNTAPDEYHAVMISIIGALTSNPINGSITGNANLAPTASPIFVTTSANCLVFYAASTDSAVSPQTFPGVMSLVSEDAGSASQSVSWSYSLSAGSTPTCSWYMSATSGDESVLTTVAINDGSSGTLIPAYVSPGSNPATVIDPFKGTTLPLGGGFPFSLGIAKIRGVTVTYDAATTVADVGINPYHAAASTTPAQSAVETLGFRKNNGPLAEKDLTNGLVLGTLLGGTPRDAVDNGKISESGTLVTFVSTGNSYRTFLISAFDAKQNFADRLYFCVDVNQEETAWVTSGSFNASSVSAIMLTSTNPRGALVAYLVQLVKLKTLVVAGGTSSNLINFNDLYDVTRHYYCLPFAQLQGSSGLLSFIPIQIGGGDPICINMEASSLQFPTIYDLTTKQINFHAASTGALGIEYYGKLGDIIKHRNSVITSTSPYYWRINNLASSAATYDFSGLTIVGAKPVNLLNVTTFSNMTFNNCGQINSNSASIFNCVISNPKIGERSALLTNTATTLNSVSFSTETPSDYAIEMPTTGTYNLTNVDFTGFSKDLLVSTQSGTATINILGGGNTPTYTSSGAVVAVNNSVNVTITCVDQNGNNAQNARVYIRRNSDGLEIINDLTSISGIVSTVYNYTGDASVTIRVRKSTSAPKFIPYETQDTIRNTGLNLAITLVEDSIIT